MALASVLISNRTLTCLNNESKRRKIKIASVLLDFILESSNLYLDIVIVPYLEGGNPGRKKSKTFVDREIMSAKVFLF